MHPHVKLHKLLRLLVTFVIFLMMIISPVESNCNSALRNVKLNSEFTKGQVRITENGKVVANGCKDGRMKCTLQTITIKEHAVLIYDPNTSMFMCWNRSFTNLVGRRNPLNLSRCMFKDKPSIKSPLDKIRYTTVQVKGNETIEHEVRFLKSGAFAQPRFVRRCLEKRRHKYLRGSQYHHIPKFNVTTTMNLNITNIKDRNSPEFQAYGSLTRFCAEPDFLQDFEGECDISKFCRAMLHKHTRHSRLAPELTQLCSRFWPKHHRN